MTVLRVATDRSIDAGIPTPSLKRSITDSQKMCRSEEKACRLVGILNISGQMGV